MISDETWIQILAYAVFVTGLIVTMKAENKRNRECSESNQKAITDLAGWLERHENRENVRIGSLHERISKITEKNTESNAEIIRAIGRLEGKIKCTTP